MITTASKLFALLDQMEELASRVPTPSVWLVSPRVRNRLAKVSLRFRKLWPAARALRRGVHRAYRRAGLTPPRVPRKGRYSTQGTAHGTPITVVMHGP